MATVEIANLGGLKDFYANISNVVGVGGKNDQNDVLLVQALFHLVGYSDAHARQHFGLSKTDLPDLNGCFDNKTKQAIWSFQRKMSQFLQNIDGKIHPANYKNRVIKVSKKGVKMMTISLLNSMAQDNALMQYNTNTISALKIVAPQLVLG